MLCPKAGTWARQHGQQQQHDCCPAHRAQSHSWPQVARLALHDLDYCSLDTVTLLTSGFTGEPRLLLLGHSHTLGQVARLIHIQTLEDGQVVGQ
eukprot:1157550-Pelagomonas_calceolata.AAC.7